MSSDMMDSIYERALSAGALGGKISGAGGGGFFMFFVDPSRRDHVRNVLRGIGAGAEFVTLCNSGTHAWVTQEVVGRA